MSSPLSHDTSTPAAGSPHPSHASAERAVIRLGTQGWNYDAWLGGFYPVGTRTADFLGVYARAFGTVEVDSTFYGVPSEQTVRSWRDRTPPGFRFALKLPQDLSHERRLRGGDETFDLFFARARQLGDRLGPVLVQLGPDFTPAELPALVRFLPRLPNGIDVAIEFRDRRWLTDGVLALLADHGVALALSDGKWVPRRQLLALAERPTASFAYVRWMGPNRDLVDHSRVQVDRSRELHAWAGALGTLAAATRAVYGYVSNHFAGHSPASVRELQRLLGQRPVDPATLGEQMSLF